MFYRLRRNLKYFKFHKRIQRLLDTPPLIIQDAHQQDSPLNIVSMVAGYDVKLYILAIKAFYRRIGHGRITAITDGVSAEGKALLEKHIPGIEIVPVETIDTGSIQRGGTWERLLFCIDRSATHFVIQLDADVLCVGPMQEVLDAVQANRAFTLAEGIPKKPLNSWVADAYAKKSDNIVIDFEMQGPQYPDSDKILYLRGSSGFAGFARGAIDRAFVQDFYGKALQLMGPRWKEWGTEQISSNFCIANSPDSFGLPWPRYMTWEHHRIPPDISLMHFLGYCRFDDDVLVNYANREIDAMLGVK